MTALQDTGAPGGSQVRTYGGWRRRRGLGLGNLDGRQSLILVVTVLVVLMAAVISLRLALVLAVPAVLLLAVTVAHWDGVWATDAALARLRFARAARAGQTTYRSGVVVDHPRAWQLRGCCPRCAAWTSRTAKAGATGWSGTGAPGC